MHLLATLVLAASAAFAALPAAAQFAKSDDAIEYRQGALFVMGQHFGRLGAMVKGQVPYDTTAAVHNAEIVAFMSHLPWAGFGPGTEGGKAKPAIWKEEAKFKDLSEKVQAETGKLATAAKAGTLEALKTQFEATGKSCKTCHDSFRKK